MKRPLQQYYEDYWTQGISAWSPSDVQINPMEEKLLLQYVSRDARVLDFGCGDGSHFSKFFLAHRCSYLGLDVSDAAVRACCKKGLSALHFQPDQPLPVGNDSFDLVLCFEVLEHIFDPLAAIREISRVLRPGGRFLGSVPNVAFVGNRLLLLLGHFNPGGSPETSLKAPWADPHIRFFSRTAMYALLREAGFVGTIVRGEPFSLMKLPLLYHANGAIGKLLDLISIPVRPLGTAWPSVFSHRLYFVATKQP